MAGKITENLAFSMIFAAIFIAVFCWLPNFHKEDIVANVSGGISTIAEDLPIPEPVFEGEQPMRVWGTSDVPPVLSLSLEEKQNMLDDIAEKLDIIAAQIEQIKKDRGLIKDEPPKEPEKIKEEDKKDPPKEEQAVVKTADLSRGGGAPKPVYPKILISEVQPAGASDKKEEFVELYNPNIFDMDLSDWYLQKKTSADSGYSTFASRTLFSGKTFPAKSYFLIARQDYFTGSGDVFVENSIGPSAYFALKNPNGEISDEFSFGSGDNFAPQPGSGQTVGRKVSVDASEQDTDNDKADFELQTPTPKAQNQTYVTPPLPPVDPPLPPAPPEPQLKNILINEVQIEGDSVNDDWVELYNPNDVEVDISQYSIQRSPVSGLIYKKNFEEGDKIAPKGYFLVARNNANAELLALANMVSSALQLSENTTIYLVKNHEEIIDQNDADIADRVGIGSLSCGPETNPAPVPDKKQSIQRKDFQDTDNNLADFELADPTPGTENRAFEGQNNPLQDLPPGA